MPFFSASTTPPGFFDPNITDQLPADAVEITFDELGELLDALSKGGTLAAGEDGRPVVIPHPEPTDAEIAARALAQRDDYLRQASLRIGPLQDAVDLDEATSAEQVELKAWKAYRVALSRIQDVKGFPRSFTWPASPVEKS